MLEVEISRVKHLQRDDAPPEFAGFVHYQHPYTTLGPLHSHAHPHFVLFNAGEKLAPLSGSSFLTLAGTTARCMDIPTADALILLTQIRAIYEIWAMEPPPHFIRDLSKKRSHSDFGEGGDRNGSTHREKRSRSRNSSHPPSQQEDGGYSHFNPQVDSGTRHVALLPPTADTPDLEMDEMEECNSPLDSNSDHGSGQDSAASDTYISQWVQGAAATSEGGWEPTVVNDEQLGPYGEERARSPRQESWHTWHASWFRRGLKDIGKPPPDTRTFSSNDWSLYDYCTLLTHSA
jgi:hypothetical protein